MASKVYGYVLERILKVMDQGIVPWKCPWKGGGKHTNIITDIPYHGVNVMMLNIDSLLRKYKYSFWVTWKQAKRKKWSIKKGAKTSLIVWFKPYDEEVKKEDGTITTETRHALRYYRIFNIQDIEGYEDIDFITNKIGIYASKQKDIELSRQASMLTAYLKAEGIELKHEVQRAYYTTSDDSINMPNEDSFVSDKAYYQALSHEITHSTGSPKRLNRFGDWSGTVEEYSREELIAEIGSAMLCEFMNITPDYKNTASYLAGWSKYLKSEKKTEIFAAAKHAENAVEFVKKRAVAGAIGSIMIPAATGKTKKGDDNV